RHEARRAGGLGSLSHPHGIIPFCGEIRERPRRSKEENRRGGTSWWWPACGRVASGGDISVKVKCEGFRGMTVGLRVGAGGRGESFGGFGACAGGLPPAGIFRSR